MTAAQKAFIEIQKQQSTLRGEFNTLRAVETRSAEQDGRLTALDGELTDSETAFRTAADGSGVSCATGRTLATCTTPFSKSAARRTEPRMKRSKPSTCRRT